MKLDTTQKSRNRLKTADITVGTNITAQYTDNEWYDAKVVMVTDGLHSVMYGVVFPQSLQVHQVSRCKIRTKLDLEQTAVVAGRLSMLHRAQVREFTQRLSVSVLDYRMNGGVGEIGEEEDWSDWSVSGEEGTDSTGE